MNQNLFFLSLPLPFSLANPKKMFSFPLRKVFFLLLRARRGLERDGRWWDEDSGGRGERMEGVKVGVEGALLNSLKERPGTSETNQE